MTEINEKTESRLSPIKFFISKKHAEQAIVELAPHLEVFAHWIKAGVWTSWYVKEAYRGYLRESGEIY